MSHKKQAWKTDFPWMGSLYDGTENQEASWKKKKKTCGGLVLLRTVLGATTAIFPANISLQPTVPVPV